ncbi:MAG: hypothetical protein WCK05_07500 [Planctomycetota bacterium]
MAAPPEVVGVNGGTSAAGELLAAGKRALEAGQSDRAVLFLERAVQIAPGDEDAQLLLATAQRQVAQARGESTITRLKDMRAVARGMALRDFEEALRKAQEAAQAPQRAKDLDVAAEQVKNAGAILETNRRFLGEGEYLKARQRTDEVGKWLEARRAFWEQSTQKAQDREIAGSEALRAAETNSRRQRRMAELRQKAASCLVDRKFEEARTLLQEILRLEPKDPWASGQIESSELEAGLRDQRRIAQDFAEQTGKTQLDLRASEVPWSEEYKHPADWVEKTVRRQGFLTGEGDPAAMEANRRFMQAMQVPVTMNFDESSLGDVVGFLREVTGANIHVKWRVLAGAEITPETRVSIKAKGLSAETALRTVLDSVSSGDKKLLWQVDGGVLTVTLQSDQASAAVMRMYDIRDMLTEVPDFHGPRMPMPQVGPSAQGGGNQGGLQGNGGGGAAGGGDQPVESNRRSRKEIMDELLQTITTTVEPGSWDGSEGGLGKLPKPTIVQGHMIITQTPTAHQAIAKLLREMRRQQGVQVMVEARLLVLERGFLERIGIDVDLTFKVGPGGVFKKLIFAGNQITQNGADWASAVSGFSEATAVAALPPAMTIAGAFLENVQVDFLIQAVQASQQTMQLDAPRLLLQNGQTSYISIGAMQAYISTFNPTVANGVAAVTPEISWLATGRMLEVNAVVSDDLRFVTMTVRYETTPFAEVTAFPFGDLGGVIMLPTIDRRDLETTVRCPDGGTLLLGGTKEARSEAREIGVPILSKVPVLNRGFLNRSSMQDQTVTYFLISPKIILPAEREDLAFPPRGVSAAARR